MKSILFSVSLLLIASACVAQQPEPVDPPGPIQQDPQPVNCPPNSYTVTNNSTTASKDISYSCEGNQSGFTTIPPGSSVVFKKNGCGPGEENCIDCGVIRIFGPNGEELFSCGMQTAYFTAYGIDLAAMGFTISDTNMPEQPDVAEGHVSKVKYWAVPILDEDGEFVDWEFTNIEPRFSVEDGEVVIRNKLGTVIGSREGITVGKDTTE